MNTTRLKGLRLDSSDRDVFMPEMKTGDVLRDLSETLRRRWAIIAGAVTAAAVLAAIYALSATPLFSANGALLIDPRVGRGLETENQVTPALLMSDALTVDSELRVLTSREVTASAIRALGLEPEPHAGPSLARRVAGLFGRDPSADAPDADMLPEDLRRAREMEALRRDFMRNMDVSRAGDTFVIDLAYRSPDRRFAAEAVNTLMREYLRLSVAQKTANIERNRVWLEERIAQLGGEVQAAETAVAEYRRANDLLAPEGQLLPTEVGLNAAIEELVTLRSQALALSIQVAQLDEQIAAGAIDAIQIAEEERTSALDDFETRYAELQQEEQALLVNWAPDAPVVVTVRQQLAQTRALIIAEYAVIRDRLRAAADALDRRVASLGQVTDELSEQYGEDVRSTVELRRLERDAEAKRELYERLLEEYNSAAQLLTFDATSARVIAWAVPPDVKAAPQSRQVVILAAFAGLVLALGAVFVLEATDGSFRRQDDVADALGLPHLGLIPSFPSEQDGEDRPPDAGDETAEHQSGLPPNARRLDFVLRHPSSVTADALRMIHMQLAARHDTIANGRGGVVVGVTSAVEGEGKTTTAANFANLLADRGERAVLVDLDLVTRRLTGLVAPILPARNTLRWLVEDPEASAGALQAMPEFPGLAIVGNADAGPSRSAAPGDIDRLDTALAALRARFDYVIVDLPSLQARSDTPALAALCDRLIFTIRWGRTPRDQVAAALRRRGLDRSRILGVLYTRAPLPRYRSYNPHDIALAHG
ncbi:GumC family protein [Jannaschia ovalis]|uniref:GNVR domain-containing protein n=1 Tax=Jannaschia ovalis TaxID=3038773 RepID=A0ABY8LC68_9RHOB|nr:GNVR domain-containing protein [Jannaschia sp. GRR-S6-38]WGH78924.1 GNVR domain-containing protein [Jannaschia sp. GRR-S6-38]